MAQYADKDIEVTYLETENGLRYTLMIQGKVDMSMVTSDQVNQRLRHLAFDKFQADDKVRGAINSSGGYTR